MMAGETKKLIETEILNNLRLQLDATGRNLQVTLSYRDKVISSQEVELVEHEPDPRSLV